jgi:hypothetical protein
MRNKDFISTVEGVALVNEHFNTNIDPRGDLTNYENILDMLFGWKGLFHVTKEEFVNTIKRHKIRKLQDQIDAIKNS